MNEISVEKELERVLFLLEKACQRCSQLLGKPAYPEDVPLEFTEEEKVVNGDL